MKLQSEQLQSNPDHCNMYLNGVMTLIRIPPNLFYLSCPSENCKKKVEPSNGSE